MVDDIGKVDQPVELHHSSGGEYHFAVGRILLSISGNYVGLTFLYSTVLLITQLLYHGFAFF
jgi:hypothetical protein